MLYQKQFDKLIGAICLPAVHQKDPFSPTTTLLMQIDNMTSYHVNENISGNREKMHKEQPFNWRGQGFKKTYHSRIVLSCLAIRPSYW